MSIELLDTFSDNTKIFLLNLKDKKFVKSEFFSQDNLNKSFFAESILQDSLVSSILINSSFISLTKKESAKWIYILDNVFIAIDRAIQSQLSLFTKSVNNDLFIFDIEKNVLTFSFNSIVNLKGYDIFFDNTLESDLVNDLFKTNFVERVIFFEKRISCVIKGDISDLNKAIFALENLVFNHFNARLGFYNDMIYTSYDIVVSEADAVVQKRKFDEKEKAIIEIMQEEILPSVVQDGGDVKFIKFENNIVHIQLDGACSGCSLSSSDLQGQIEKLLKFYFTDVQKVVFS